MGGGTHNGTFMPMRLYVNLTGETDADLHVLVMPRQEIRPHNVPKREVGAIRES